MDMMQRPTVMKYENYLYLKIMSLVAATALLAYAVFQPDEGEAYGGTVMGYVLGTVALLMVLWLTWYGIRKRMTPKVQDQRAVTVRRSMKAASPKDSFKKRKKTDRRKHAARDSWLYGGTLQGWLSAHIYTGSFLVIIATLHSGMHFSWNIHTLSYVLMLLVIASGFYGTYAYLNYPRLITQNIGDDTLKSLLEKISELDELARIRALGLPDEVNQLALKSRQNTRLGGNLLQQLIGTQRNCPTEYAAQQLQKLGDKYIKEDQPKLMRDLYSVMLRKQTLVLRVRQEVMLRARLQFWLYLHVPLTIALLAALLTHILAIFFYW